mmetsp:Transcript_49524/g.115863  ORF Transcript_49524/g.115863 Transcript_49524/m.115863 type:complete len:339 (+) Transcript_49524:34-1050(+)
MSRQNARACLQDAELAMKADGDVPQPCIYSRFMSNSQCLGHTVYHIEITVGSRSWFVEKRYSDVRALRDRLSTWLYDRQPTIPGKKVWGNQDVEFVKERQQGLELYLNRTLEIVTKERPFLLGTIIAEFLTYTQGDREVVRELADQLELQRSSAVQEVKSLFERAPCQLAKLPAAAIRQAGARSLTPLRNVAAEFERSCHLAPQQSYCQQPRKRRWSRRLQETPVTASISEEALEQEPTPRQHDVKKPEAANNVGDRPEQPVNRAVAASIHDHHPADPSLAWEWPLSRQETKVRVALIDQQMSRIEKDALLGEIRRLQCPASSSTDALLHGQIAAVND